MKRIKEMVFHVRREKWGRGIGDKVIRVKVRELLISRLKILVSEEKWSGEGEGEGVVSRYSAENYDKSFARETRS